MYGFLVVCTFLQLNHDLFTTGSHSGRFRTRTLCTAMPMSINVCDFYGHNNFLFNHHSHLHDEVETNHLLGFTGNSNAQGNHQQERPQRQYIH